MSDALHLVQLRFDMAGLLRHGRRRGRDARLSDDGYLTHMVLKELFGSFAPSPFRLKPGGEGGQLTVLGYSAADVATLAHTAEMAAEPDVFGLWRRADSASKPMPAAWPADQRLAFEVLATPVRRVGASTALGGDRPLADPTGSKAKNRRATWEVCAWLAEQQRLGETARDRPTVYLEWLAEQIQRGGAATVEAARIDRLDRETLWRPRHRTGTGSQPERPHVQFSGTLRIADPAAFGELLARGIGRHRAFGLGMLLLRPA